MTPLGALGRLHFGVCLSRFAGFLVRLNSESERTCLLLHHVIFNVRTGKPKIGLVKIMRNVFVQGKKWIGSSFKVRD